MEHPATLEDIVGLDYVRLGFFGELKSKIVELQNANEKLGQKQDKLQAIIDGISDAMAILSTDFTLVSVNRLFFDFFDCPAPRGQTCHGVLKNRQSPCPDCPVVKARKTQGVCRQTMVFPVAGKKRQFEVSVSPMKDQDKKIVRFILLMRDVTREKRFQEQYYYSQKMAAVGLLAEGVAHEINNPLTAVNGFSEGLKRRLPKLKQAIEHNEKNQILLGDVEEYIDIIIDECNRCRDIVKNLLTFGPRKNAVFSPVNLKSLVGDVLKLLQHRFKQNPDVNVTMDVQSTLIKGSGPEIKQVLLNLICNAMDALEEKKGKIQIFTTRDPNWMILNIKDTGCGIPKKYMDLLFDPFFTTKPPGRGVGIGLSFCYNIMHTHGGDIRVFSEEGQGSLFSIYFPRLKEG